MKALPLIAALTATLPAGPAPAYMLTLEIHPADDPPPDRRLRADP
jgi:hypothetical protein